MASLLNPVRVPSSGQAPFQNLRAIAFGQDRSLYVLNSTTVSVFSPAPTHAYVRQFGSSILTAANGLAVDGAGNTWVVENFNTPPPIVTAFDASGGMIARWNAGSESYGTSILVDPVGRINVGGESIFRYSVDGGALDRLGTEGSNPGQSLAIYAMQWQSPDSLWVADRFNNRIAEWNATIASLTTEFGAKCCGNGCFDCGEDAGASYGPSSLAIDSAGNLYANDPYVYRIQKFVSGVQQGEFDYGPGTIDLNSLAIEPASGNLYVARTGSIDILCPF